MNKITMEEIRRLSDKHTKALKLLDDVRCLDNILPEGSAKDSMLVEAMERYYSFIKNFYIKPVTNKTLNI